MYGAESIFLICHHSKLCCRQNLFLCCWVYNQYGAAQRAHQAQKRCDQITVNFYYEEKKLTYQRHKKRRQLDVCEYAAHVSFLNSPPVYMFLG